MTKCRVCGNEHSSGGCAAYFASLKPSKESRATNATNKAGKRARREKAADPVEKASPSGVVRAANGRSKESFREYQREYMKAYRAKKRGFGGAA